MSDGHSTEPKNEPTEPKAKQILSEFAGRLTLVERMTARLRPLRPPSVHLGVCLIILNFQIHIIRLIQQAL